MAELCYLEGNKITKEGNKSQIYYIIYLKLRNGEKQHDTKINFRQSKNIYFHLLFL